MFAHAWRLAGLVSAVVGTSYVATLTPPVGSSSKVTGTVQMTGTAVAVQLSHGTPGAVYPWYIHAGHCGDKKSPLVDSANVYTPITIQADSTGQGTATLHAPLPDSGLLSVDVHAPGSKSKIILSCGDASKSDSSAQTKPGTVYHLGPGGVFMAHPQ